MTFSDVKRKLLRLTPNDLDRLYKKYKMILPNLSTPKSTKVKIFVDEFSNNPQLLQRLEKMPIMSLRRSLYRNELQF